MPKTQERFSATLLVMRAFANFPGASRDCADKVNSCPAGRESALGYFRDLPAVLKLNVRARRFTRLTLVLALLATPTGCTTLGYYHQAITGHLGLMLQRQPIDRLIASDQTDPDVVTQLRKVEGLLKFSREQLGLPSDGQYASYVDTRRRYVVWNVFAAPQLSLEAKQWCYPVVGCASYRGYYSEQQARRYAAGLAEDGMDVYVGGTAAYSTLGWFKDPILNTFLFRRDDQLADLLFHELAHHLLYIGGDTVFNESFASLVAHEGVKRWLGGQDDPDGYATYLAAQARKQQFIDLVHAYRERFAVLYASAIPEDAMLAEKQRIVSELKTAHRQLKDSWGGYSVYDHWFSREINNAQLNTVATYYELVPAFQALLSRHGENLAEFYDACLELTELDMTERQARLNALLTSAPPVDTTGHSDLDPGQPILTPAITP